MSIIEKPISYYLELLRDNPTTELDAPTIAMLLQAFRAYLLENINNFDSRVTTLEGVHLHEISASGSDNLDINFLIKTNSTDEITLDTLPNIMGNRVFYSCSGSYIDGGDSCLALAVYYDEQDGYSINCFNNVTQDNSDSAITITSVRDRVLF